jgi:uncharacterized protein YdhG (YjbR/CyaY superfamily)
MENFKTIHSYIVAQKKELRPILKEIYTIIKSEAPDASEVIKYGMPTFVGKGNIVHFAAMKGHLGFYPAPSAIEEFAQELMSFKTSKGCVRFSYDKPLPKTLIAKMVRFRVREDKKLK